MILQHHRSQRLVEVTVVYFLTLVVFVTVSLSDIIVGHLSLWTTVNSIVLLTNGISFAIQALLLLAIGAWADYGSWRCVFSCSVYSNFGPILHVLSRPNITIFFTILAVCVSFAWLKVDTPDQWRAGIALYILGCKHSQEHRSYRRLTLYSDIVPGI